LSIDAANERELDHFLGKGTPGLDAREIRVYRSKLSGRERLGVIYGDFASIAAANAELARIARLLPGSGPYVRAVSKLR